MKGVQLTAPGQYRLRTDLPIPEPGPREVRLRVAASGICGTDVHICSGDPSMNGLIAPPVVLGHEFCGYVDKLGPGVDEKKLPLGSYVSAEMHEICGECPACRSGAYHACATARIRGINLDGAFADFVVVSAGNVVKLPADLPVQVAAILDPLGNAVHTTLKVPIGNRTVAIVGFGPIGAMCGEIATFVDASHVFVVDVADQALARARAWVIRRNLADRVTVVDGREKPVETIVDATRGGVDVALEISGHPAGINNAIAMTRAAGHVVNLGLPKGDTVGIEKFSKNFIFKGLTMHAVIGREMFRTWEQMLDLLQQGMDISHLVTAEMPLEQFGVGLERFGKGQEQKVVLYPNDRLK
ncbi:MAG TPA: alcohol dehydrogenase catalytic domain-containing protein [Planctomycetota bacterium]|nr:alcohol dehydrogenase catalytic domain-containing protein [Planctomycetota bacterium]